MATIKVADFAFPRMEAPDLDEMEEFLTHFGLIRAERTPDALYMRGADSHHHLHVAQKGGTKFIGFAYHAADEDDLKRIAKLPGASGIDNVIGSFSRLDRGADYVDHHVLFCVHNEKTGLNHVSYEAQDIDAIFQDHEYIKKLGKYEHMWGIGRHLLGSQIYDYWSDPWGRVHEHWSDTDRLNTKNGSNLISAEAGLVSQWGERPPERFLNRVIA